MAVLPAASQSGICVVGAAAFAGAGTGTQSPGTATGWPQVGHGNVVPARAVSSVSVRPHKQVTLTAAMSDPSGNEIWMRRGVTPLYPLRRRWPRGCDEIDRNSCLQI